MRGLHQPPMQQATGRFRSVQSLHQLFFLVDASVEPTCRIASNSWQGLQSECIGRILEQTWSGTAGFMAH